MEKRKAILLVGIISFFLCNYCSSASAESDCFIAMKDGKILLEKGECQARHAPASTFKMAISLIAFNEGLLKDEEHPVKPFKKGYAEEVPAWKQDQTPRTWIKNSCVWYSRLLTQELGVKKFSDYIQKFNYGNQDVSGDPGKGNGLTQAWLSSSLKISPKEQLLFLQKMLAAELPVSLYAIEKTKSILHNNALVNDWKLYGKTGTGTEEGQATGWFVGWAEKEDATILFVQFIKQASLPPLTAGQKAKSMAIEELDNLIKKNP